MALTVEGMRHAGCAWLVEGLLGKAPGVRTATVDFPLRRAEVRFDPRVTGVNYLLESLAGAVASFRGRRMTMDVPVALGLSAACSGARLAVATHCLADKTGTLTEGRFRLRATTKLGSVPEASCLAIAAALERYATHPAAAAIGETSARAGQALPPEVDAAHHLVLHELGGWSPRGPPARSPSRMRGGRAAAPSASSAPRERYSRSRRG